MAIELRTCECSEHSSSLCNCHRNCVLAFPMVVIALLTLDIHIPHAHSLKDKRMVFRRLKDRLRSKFNVAVAEVEHQELWQRTQLSVVTVGSSESYVKEALQARA